MRIIRWCQDDCCDRHSSLVAAIVTFKVGERTKKQRETSRSLHPEPLSPWPGGTICRPELTAEITSAQSLCRDDGLRRSAYRHRHFSSAELISSLSSPLPTASMPGVRYVPSDMPNCEFELLQCRAAGPERCDMRLVGNG